MSLLRFFRKHSIDCVQKILAKPSRLPLQTLKCPTNSIFMHPVENNPCVYMKTRKLSSLPDSDLKEIEEMDLEILKNYDFEKGDHFEKSYFGKSHVLQLFGDDAHAKVPFSFEYFEKLERDVIEENFMYSVKFFDNMVMIELRKAKNLEGAKVFLDFLLQKRGRIALIPRVFYISILGFYNIENKLDQVIFSQYEECVEIYNNVFDEACLKMLIKAYSTTKQWNKALEWMGTLQTTVDSHFNAYANILQTVVCNKNMEVFYPIFDKAVKDSVDIHRYNNKMSENISLQKFLSFLLSIIETKPETVDISVVLTLLEKYCIFPDETMIDRIAACIKRNYYCEVYKTEVDNSGQCHKCKKVLKSDILTNDEYRLLKKEYVKSQKIGPDPEELKNFKKDLAENGPFDLIVDHSNMLYSGKGKRMGKKTMATIIKHFVRKGMKTLVVIKGNDLYRYSGAFTYNIECSNDDFFILYAALDSGKDAMILSGDSFRESNFLHGEKYTDLFMRWKRTRQIAINKDKYNVFAENPKRYDTRIFPKTYDPRAQISDGILHIPIYTSEIENKDDIVRLQVPRSYLCVQFKKSRIKW